MVRRLYPRIDGRSGLLSRKEMTFFDDALSDELFIVSVFPLFFLNHSYLKGQDV